jgi:hypothetical protein
MSTTEITKPIAESSRSRVEFVGMYYVLTILMGAFVLLCHGRMAFAADAIATVFYVAVTALFYELSRSGNRKAR